jgi:hypothetical protein
MSAAPAPPARGTSGGPRMVPLVLYAVAMGWLEGVVVVYIRAILGLAHGAATPSPAEVVAHFHEHPWLLPTEQAREMATLAMIGAVSWLAARRWRARAGAFLVIFGVWDIVYYVALYTMLRWPTSLTAMDVLFLVPPSPLWNQPVWVPVAISCGMIALGARLIGTRPRMDVR